MTKAEGKSRRGFFQLATEGSRAELSIYGDITSWPILDSDVSSHSLSQQLAELDVDEICVNINSYGGEVAEGLAIYNALRRHPARVVTRVDGFACSIASVIFMAGEERTMSDASLLMVHNAMICCENANAAQLRKAADDVEKITEASKAAYLDRASVSEQELAALMDAETWISPAEAVEMGFATSVETYEAEPGPATQSARPVLARLIAKLAQEDPEEPAEDPEADPEGPEGEPEADHEEPEGPEADPEKEPEPEEEPEEDPEEPVEGEDDPEEPEEDPEEEPEGDEEPEAEPEEDPEGEDGEEKDGPEQRAMRAALMLASFIDIK